MAGSDSSMGRLREIITVFASYGFGHIYRVHIKNKETKQDASNFRKAFEELGPSFIKIGQILSTRSDLFPPDYIEELRKLQDDAPRFSIEEVRRIFQEEFDQDIEEVFEYFEEIPMASASIAQVHRARKLNGVEVIVKVQRPDIEEALIRDINLLGRVFEYTPNFINEMVADPKLAFQEIENRTRSELDFRNEGAAMLRFKANNSDIAPVDSPMPDNDYISKRVIIQEFVDGIHNLEKSSLVKAGYDLDDLGEKLILSFLNQVFRDGFYHGDPHPGNIIISNQKINFIDFGIVGELTDQQKETLTQMLIAVASKDIDALVSLLMQITYSKEKIDQADLYEDVAYFFDIYLSRGLQDIDISTISNDILNIIRKHKMTMPHDLITLGRAFIVIEGIIADLAPELNVYGLAKDYLIQSNAHKFISLPSKEKAAFTLYSSAKDLFTLPAALQESLGHLNNGRMKVQIQLYDLEDIKLNVNKMINRLVFAIIVASLVLASALIISSGGTGISIIGFIIFLGAAMMGLWLLISIIRSGTL